jgi:predicted peptidase
MKISAITFFLLVLMISIIIMNCSSNSTNSPGDEEVIESSLKLSDNTNLLYSLFLPAGFDKNSSGTSLIVSLHYGWSGQMSAYYGKELVNELIKPALGKSGSIIVAPDCPGTEWTNYKSETAIIELINYLKKEYKIDSNKIVVTGFSLGGQGTWYMIGNYPKVFCAGIVISGMAEESWITDIKNKPLYVIHSLKDEVFPFLEVQKIITLVQKQDTLLNFVPVIGISHYETAKFLPALQDAAPWLNKILNSKN